MEPLQSAHSQFGVGPPDPLLQEKDLLPFTRKLDQIDLVLKEPVETLIEQVCQALELARESGTTENAERPTLPSWLSETVRSEESNALCSAICYSTVQRLWRIRRRFPQLKKKFQRLERTQREFAKSLGGGGGQVSVPVMLAEPFADAKWQDLFKSQTFGPLDPFTASQVLTALLGAGEQQVHARNGFFAFFIIVQGLRRRFPEQADAGVSLGFCPPHGWITAKCWLPAHALARICARRAKLFEELAEWLERRAGDRELQDRFVTQRLQIQLDDLSGRFFTLSGLAIPQDGLLSCARELEAWAIRSDRVMTWWEVLDRLAAMVLEIGKALDVIIRTVEVTLGRSGDLGKFCEALKKATRVERDKALEDIGLSEIIPAEFVNIEREERYWKNEAQAADEALAVCIEALRQFEAARDCCQLLAPIAAAESKNMAEIGALRNQLVCAFRTLAKTNFAIGAAIAEALRDSSLWCERQLHRQIAYASAGDETHFDPAELVGALMVAVRDGRIDSPLPLEDAIRKILRGGRSDGSWAPGQPFFSKNGLGSWAASGDISWMLADLSSQFPRVTAADETLSAWVDWADRNRQKLTLPAKDSNKRPGTASGWSFERGVGARIDLWATAYNVNALLAIRDLMEYRLWELCERRFTVIQDSKELSAIDPVDLGFAHQHRLHYRLARMARRSDGDEFANAEYSLILHGPPGSSKTAITQALSDVMWRGARPKGRGIPRLIRITPADFTRLGEDRIDSEARLIFELLRRVRGVTILFDEIDDLLRQRAGSEKLHFLDLVVPAMLNRLQDLRDACPRQETCFLLATNYIERIERALIRPGRIDAPIAVVYPDRVSRGFIVSRHVRELRELGKDEPWAEWGADLLNKEWTDREDQVGKHLDGVPWKTLDEVLRGFRQILKDSYKRTDGDRGRRAWGRLVERIELSGPQELLALYEAERLRKKLTVSPELRDEVLLQILSMAGTRKEFDRATLKICKKLGISQTTFPRVLKDEIWSRRATA